MYCLRESPGGARARLTRGWSPRGRLAERWLPQGWLAKLSRCADCGRHPGLRRRPRRDQQVTPRADAVLPDRCDDDDQGSDQDRGASCDPEPGQRQVDEVDVNHLARLLI